MQPVLKDHVVDTAGAGEWTAAALAVSMHANGDNACSVPAYIDENCHFIEYFYDENCNLTENIDMVPGGVVLNIGKGHWHNLRCLEPLDALKQLVEYFLGVN